MKSFETSSIVNTLIKVKIDCRWASLCHGSGENREVLCIHVFLLIRNTLLKLGKERAALWFLYPQPLTSESPEHFTFLFLFLQSQPQPATSRPAVPIPTCPSQRVFSSCLRVCSVLPLLYHPLPNLCNFILPFTSYSFYLTPPTLAVPGPQSLNLHIFCSSLRSIPLSPPCTYPWRTPLLLSPWPK